MGAAVRVSVAAGTRRVDVALPAAVPVAELVPELAAVLGMTGAATIATVTGRRLATDQSLAVQDVVDGSVLVLTTGRLPPPRIHDDPAEAMAEAVEEYVAPWPSGARRPAALVASALLLATALGAALHPLAAVAPVPARCLLAAAALLVLAGDTFPRWAVTTVVRTAGEGPVDLDRTRADAGRAHRLLLGMVAGTGLLLVAIAPLAAELGPWAMVLVVDAAVVLALRARRHHSGAEVLAALVTALAAVLVTATLATDQPRSLAAATAGTAATGALLLTGLAVPASARRARAAELLEALAVVALLPLVVAATGLLPWLRTAVAR
ncbi:hypothetical protein GCM10028801_09530 [Nocardioides maradonensis]